MANKMLSNIQSLTQAVETLTRKVNELYSSIDKVAKVSADAVSGAQDVLSSGGQVGLGQGSGLNLGVSSARFAPMAQPGMPGTETTQMMPGAMGRFSFSWRFNTADPEVEMLQRSIMTPSGGGGGGGGIPFLNKLTGPLAQGAFGLAQIQMGVAAGMYAATPDLSMTMQRNIGYYQAAMRVPGTNRAALERQTLGAMGGGLSSVGSDAIVAALLSSRGFGPGTAAYSQIAGEVGGAFRYLGIENAAAANAITSMQRGPMATSLLGLGVSVYDTEKNRPRSTADIARQLLNVMAPGGVSGPQAIQESLAYGALGANLESLGLDPAMRVMVEQAMLDISAGRNPDLREAQPTAGNPNTALTAAGRMNASQTNLMMAATDSMIKGFENAADTVEAFNRALENAMGPLGYMKGIIGGVGGTNIGEGLAAALPLIISGLKDLLTAFTGASGGGTSGYGASFSKGRPKGGGPSFGQSSALISAAFGEKDNSGIWSSTNNTHTGTDFAVPIGTPVVAAMEGVVSSITPGTDYGTAVVIDHPNGYQTLYGHLSAREVGVGDTISKGQRIGRSGDTGNTTGPHLHYEVRQGKNNPVDPAYLQGESPIGSVFKAAAYEGGAVLGTGKQKGWARQLLERLGAPATPGNLSAITTWMRFEGGHWKNSAHYNPLNTTLDMGGNKSMNSVGVKKYKSWEQGLDATVNTLLGKSSAERGYAAIIQALQSDAGAGAVLNAVNNSAWRSGKVNDPGYKFSGGGTSGFGASMPDRVGAESGTQNVYITVKFEQPDGQSAYRFAKQVEDLLNRRNNNSLIGGN